MLTHLDTSVMVWIHTHLHQRILDEVMLLARDKWTWVPAYIFLVAFMLMNFGKRGGLWLLLFIFAVALSDTVSTKVIKNNVRRPRPCHTEQVAEKLDMLVSCGGPYGFVSSHASNHFAMATFIWLTLGGLFRRIRWPVAGWAALISFAQVYVGVHYPSDVIAGAILGILVGGLTAWYYHLRLRQWDVGLTPPNLN